MDAPQRPTIRTMAGRNVCSHRYGRRRRNKMRSEPVAVRNVVGTEYRSTGRANRRRVLQKNVFCTRTNANAKKKKPNRNGTTVHGWKTVRRVGWEPSAPINACRTTKRKIIKTNASCVIVVVCLYYTADDYYCRRRCYDMVVEKRRPDDPFK